MKKNKTFYLIILGVVVFIILASIIFGPEQVVEVVEAPATGIGGVVGGVLEGIFR